MYAQGIIQPGRSGGLRISLPRLDVLETQMGKDVLFSRSCQELFLERGQTNRKSVTCAGICLGDTSANPQILNCKLRYSKNCSCLVLTALTALVFGLPSPLQAVNINLGLYSPSMCQGSNMQ